MFYVICLIAGLMLGAILVFIIKKEKKFDTDEMVLKLKDSLGSISLDTLTKQTELAEKTLDNKKKLIDQTLDTMRLELERVQKSLTNFDKESKLSIGNITKHLELNAENTKKLELTTNQLRETLKSSKARGQWGERMAEDVLKLAGFVENINYMKQRQLVSGNKPDYTFLLPNNMIVNMDVKFPFDNYLHYIETESNIDKEAYKKKFMGDVRMKIKEVTSRDYINPEEHTMDYVILFIPNEQIYAFIHENDSTIIDEALKSKVIFCSPLTLYAILAVIRQALDNFRMEKTAREIIALMGGFYQEWGKFIETFESMGSKIEAAQKEFGALTTTRKNKLEKQLQKIEELREHKGLPEIVQPPEEKH
jgi:DNA recombination protein RmuC